MRRRSGPIRGSNAKKHKKSLKKAGYGKGYGEAIDFSRSRPL